ncbi:MAG: PAS domain-containing protein, partial [Candidatus Omnitrophota bacterium]
MKDKKKYEELIKGKKFFEGIKFWQKQISELGNLKAILKRNKAELSKLPQKLRKQIETHMSTERIINKQLRSEIEQRKQVDRVVQDAFEYSRDIVDTVREPLLVLDADLKVISANRSFYEFFKVKPEETVGQVIYDLGNKQWNIPKLSELLETILPQKTTFDNYEVEHDFATI